MFRLSRLIGIAFSLLLLAALAVIAIRDAETGSGVAPDLRNGRIFIQDNLWSTKTHQYAVWVDEAGTPYAGRRQRGSDEWRIVDLGRLDRNPLAAPTADDQHNVYAIGTDSAGGVHIAGNMHGDPLRYVTSDARLHGFRRTPAPDGASEINYPAFVGLPDGSLLFWRREGLAGDSVAAFDALRPGDRTWRPQQTVIDGRETAESAYLHRIAVDGSTGTIHMVFVWRTERGIENNNDVGYVRSTDGGRTWERSDGVQVQLPVTHATAETVVDTTSQDSGLLNAGGLTVDADGRPHGLIAYQRPIGEPAVVHVWLDDGTWQREQLEDLDLSGRPSIVGTPDGRVWLLGVRRGTVVAVDISSDRDRLPTREIADVPAGWEVTYDTQALALHGTVELLIPIGDEPHVVVADLSGS